MNSPLLHIGIYPHFHPHPHISVFQDAFLYALSGLALAGIVYGVWRMVRNRSSHPFC